MKSCLNLFWLIPLFLSTSAKGQQSLNMAIGDWAIHTPYGGVHEIHLQGQKVYAATELGAFSYLNGTGEIQRYNKLNFLNDVGVSASAYVPLVNAFCLAYLNSNIDIVIGDETINIPSLKNDDIVADKTIYDLEGSGQDLLVATGFGLLNIDLIKTEVRFTTFFENAGGTKIRVNCVTADTDFYYAGAENGLYRIAKSHPNPIDFNAWKHFDTTDGLPQEEVIGICVFQNVVHCQIGDTLYRNNGGSWTQLLSANNRRLRGLKANANAMSIIMVDTLHNPTQSLNRILYWPPSMTLDSFQHPDMAFPVEALRDKTGTFWLADAYQGVLHLSTPSLVVLPNGPSSSSAFEMISNQGTLWVAAGSVNPAWNYQFNKDGFFKYNGFSWTDHNLFNYPALDSIFDFVSVAKDPRADRVCLGSFGGGMVCLNFATGTLQTFEASNSTLKETPGDPGSFRVPGLSFDAKGNLWVTNFPDKLHLMDRDGNWFQFDPSPSFSGFIRSILIDESGYLWMNVLQDNSNGILVYDPGSNLQSSIDDRYQMLRNGLGDPDNGDLATNDVRCLALDDEGEIWVGTTEGISVYYNPEVIFSNQDAAQIFVEQGEFTNYLLQNEIINDIVVDPANRKWVATNTGVRLVSPNGKSILNHFTAENSPLLSNVVKDIALDRNSGEVFFATELGVCSYKGEAIKGTNVHENVLVFPNPVPKNYDGKIGIKGLARGAEVKITDIAGNLVYETTATGGQAVWDGKDYLGRSAKAGVYLVFSGNESGSSAIVAKFFKAN